MMTVLRHQCQKFLFSFFCLGVFCFYLEKIFCYGFFTCLDFVLVLNGFFIVETLFGEIGLGFTSRCGSLGAFTKSFFITENIC